MKYELPEDLKTYKFFCEDKLNDVSFRSCERNCPNSYRQCWEGRLRADLALDCAVDNERKARTYVRCSHCGAICDVGLLHNRFLCNACGNVEYCDSEQQKSLMGDAFAEIDEQELSDALKSELA